MSNKDKELMLDVGQANELKLALRKAGYTNADIKQMCEGKALAETLLIIKGYAKIEMVQFIIDCDADPFCPDGLRVEEHINADSNFEWNPSKVLLYLSEKQREKGTIGGNELRKELEGKKVLNANVLDWLLELGHQELIPEKWKKKGFIFFFGTIYRDSNGNLFARYLYWNGVRWVWDHNWLDGDWRFNDPAALLAS